MKNAGPLTKKVPGVEDHADNFTSSIPDRVAVAELPALRPKFEGVPALLREQPRWLGWIKGAAKADGSGRYEKIPVNVRTYKACNAHAAANHFTFHEVCEAYETGRLAGIAFDLPNEREPIAFDEAGRPLYLIGGDIDQCVVEKADGKRSISAHATEALLRLGRPYCEVSPSGTGLRFFVLHTEPIKGGNKNGRELYSGGRFLTITGRGRGAIRHVGSELLALVHEWFGELAVAPAFVAFDSGDVWKSGTGAADLPEIPENVELIESALRAIPADCDYPVWRDIGFALHSLGWACGLELFDRWSQSAPGQYGRAAVEKLWNSAKDGAITIATLFHYAKQNGWVDPRGHVGGEHADWLQEMRLLYAWIDQEAGIYRILHRDFISPEKFKLAHANNTRSVPNGRNGTKDVSVGVLYLASGGRRQHRAVVTRPGEPEVTVDNCLNDWAGFTIQPAPGNVEPFLRLYRWIFGDERFPLLWLAHLIQHPGIKMFVSLVVWSNHQGVGKNLLFETIGTLFSPYHFALIGQSEVDDTFTGWIPGTVFVIADEIRASKSDKTSDRLKLWVTGTTLRTHDKGQPKRVVDNLMNLVFLSNHADGMFLNDHDRRFAVYEAVSGPLPESLKREFLAWREGGGSAHLLHYLQNLDIAGFDPKGRAPVTEAKRAMIEASRSDLDRWAHDIISGSIPLGREIATAEELTSRFMVEYPHVRAAPSAAVVGKVLVRMGAHRRDNQVRLSSGRKVRALALLRPDHWKGQPEAAWRTELEKRL